MNKNYGMLYLEDDLFKILKRVTFNEMCTIINDTAYIISYSDIINLLELNGWAEVDFRKYLKGL
jgi:hypothetical protein